MANEFHSTDEHPFDQIFAEEKKRISAIRLVRANGVELPNDEPYIGLALSGGGIRSAAFGLGVLHALKNHGVLQRVDYLSTVSGGGYIGAAWTYLEAKLVEAKTSLEKECTEAKNDLEKERAEETYQSQKERLQLGTRLIGAKTRNAERNSHLDHIRGHGNYVTQGDHLGFGSVIAMLLRSVMVGLAIWLPLAAFGLALLCLAASLFFGDAATVPDLLTTLPAGALVAFWGVALALLLLMAASSLWRCIWRPSGELEADYESRLGQQRWLGRLFRMTLAFALVGSLPFALELMHAVGANAAGGSPLASITSLLGGIAAFWSFFTRDRIQVGGLDVTRILAVGGAALMLYAGLVLALIIADTGMAIGTRVAALEWWPDGWPVGLFVLGLGAIASIIVMMRTDLNMIALHRLYRDRLMETFMPNPAGHDAGDTATRAEDACVGTWHPATKAEKFWLHKASPESGTGPYHLLNTNVVLLRSKNTLSAGRGGDSFVLSPLYCGSDATGWRKTEEWIRFPGAEGTDYLSLATAMAISGAAVNPNAASAGQGPTRNRFVALAMSLLNLRLAVWVPNPGKPEQAGRAATWWSPGWRILAGKAHHEREPFVELSDGGHFENLGIYELVRRRVKLIIAADAACDPQYSFADLGTALERCRVDFGVDIDFSGSDYALKQLIPQDTIGHDKNFCLARRGFAVARIRYSKDASDDGLLVYVKTTMTHDLPADVYAYKLTNPAFPDQSTGDQWFDEAQFEAYRELGYSIVQSFLNAFAKAGASGEQHHPGSDPIGYATLIEWLHGRERAAAMAGYGDSEARTAA